MFLGAPSGAGMASCRTQSVPSVRADDAVDVQAMNALKTLHRPGGQRAIAPVDRSWREPRAGQPML